MNKNALIALYLLVLRDSCNLKNCHKTQFDTYASALLYRSSIKFTLRIINQSFKFDSPITYIQLLKMTKEYL